jgi:hypothetical protein
MYDLLLVSWYYISIIVSPGVVLVGGEWQSPWSLVSFLCTIDDHQIPMIIFNIVWKEDLNNLIR